MCGKFKYTIDDLKKHAESKGGCCLSNEYLTSNDKYRWRCSEGHEWCSIWNSVKNFGSWCSECVDRYKYTIDDLKKYANSKGGLCLSVIYKGVKHKYLWKCNCGYEWVSHFDSIKNAGSWCPMCSGNVKKTIDEVKEFAIINGFECLSNEYINAHLNLDWKCSKGHIWSTSYHKIQSGHGCHVCNSPGISEEVVRGVFEDVFGVSFPRSKPKWLISSNGTRLELDGFNDDLMIAFEYNGIQHYKPVDFFGGVSSFHKRRKYDAEKICLCLENGVNLIVLDMVHRNRITSDIYKKLTALGIDIPYDRGLLF